MAVEPTLTQFTKGDIVISVVGDGEGDNNYTDNQASPIVLEEIDPTTGAIVGVLDLPQTTTISADGVTENAISGEYGSSSEGALQLAADGQSLVIAGYGVNDAEYNAGGAAVYGNAALGQSTSVPGGQFTAVPRVVADISYNTSIDTSTALYNVFNTNNPRSVATVNGSRFYLSGQGVKGDTTQGVFTTQDGENSATSIDDATDTRTVEIYNGHLYVSQDSKQPSSGGTSNISEFNGSTLPTSTDAETVLPGISQSITLTAAQENTVNSSAVGGVVALSPEAYFFANATTLYVADGGNPKQGTLGDGGLQKWTLNTGTGIWSLDYTLSAGLNLVPDTTSAGTTGLIGLTGVVNSDGTVTLYATNATVGDLDQTYLYSITDTLNATTAPAGESFTKLMTAAADTNIRGVAFAPAVATTSNTTISSGTTPNLEVTSGSLLTVDAGGTITTATIEFGGAVVISGGADENSFIMNGGTETIYGAVSGDTVEGTQQVSSGAGGTGSVSNETVFNGGVVNLDVKGVSAANITVGSAGSMTINGNISASNTVIEDGGAVILESPKATLIGGVTFVGAGTLEVMGAISSSGAGDQAPISGFAAGDEILVTAITSASLTSSIVGGNTVETITGTGGTETFIFSGASYSSGYFVLSNTTSGAELVVSGSSTSSGGGGGSNITTISAGQTTPVGYVVSSGDILDVLAGGTAVGITVDQGGVANISGTDTDSTILAGGTENVVGTVTGDIISGLQSFATSGAVLNNETVLNGGYIDIEIKGVTANGTVLESGGELSINGNSVVDDTVINGGTLVLESPKAHISNGLTFTGGGEILITSAVASAGYGDLTAISGFQNGDIIAIDTSLLGNGITLASTISGGNTIETISGSTGSESFTFAGSYPPGSFQLNIVGGEAELTTDQCYCAGTRILTTAGEVAVEEIEAGDQVITASGARKTVLWTGSWDADLDREAGQRKIIPVRIASGALGENIPHRDLYVSPDHSLFLDGALVPAYLLVNGTTITQPQRNGMVTYHHVQVEPHDILLAEGAAAESFLDLGTTPFSKPSEEPRSWEDACAPLVLGGPQLTRIREKISALAPVCA